MNDDHEQRNFVFLSGPPGGSGAPSSLSVHVLFTFFCKPLTVHQPGMFHDFQFDRNLIRSWKSTVNLQTKEKSGAGGITTQLMSNKHRTQRNNMWSTWTDEEQTPTRSSTCLHCLHHQELEDVLYSWSKVKHVCRSFTRRRLHTSCFVQQF